MLFYINIYRSKIMTINEHNYHISKGLNDFLDDLDFKLNHPNELKGISTGYDYLDTKLDGLKSGEVTIIGARPAMGKTSFAINITYNLAVNFYRKHQENEQDNRCVVYIGLEYLPKEFARKLISLQSHIPFYQLRIGDELNENFAKIQDAERAINELPIYYVDDAYEVDDIAQKLHKIEQEKQIGCVVIDYLQLLGEEYQTKEDYSMIMLQIKELAVKFDVPVIVLSQLKRELETRADKRPLMCDIRGYVRNQNAADNILFLYRESYYIRNLEPTKRKKETEEHYQQRLTEWQERCKETEYLCEIIIAKNTNGYYGIVRLYFDWSTGLFWNGKEDDFNIL